MAQSRTITAATAAFILTIPGVYSSGVALQAFAVDDAFDVDSADAAEVQVGVDGVGVAGWVPRQYRMTIAFQASSPSVDVFDQWLDAEDAAGPEIIYASGVIRLISVRKQIDLAQGALTRPSRLPNARRVLQMRQFEIVWMPPSALVPAISVSPML